MVEEKDVILLPTGKPNVSFSEVKSWSECSWRHKLQQVDKINLSKPGEAMDFGTSVHASHEHFIKTGVMDTTIATNMIRKFWEDNKHVKWDLEKTCKEAEDCLNEVPVFYEKCFAGWEGVEAEHQLYEIIKDGPHIFKGFIDAIVKVKEMNKDLYWVLDVKTTSWGWKASKKNDDMIKAQIVLYKYYWARKNGIDPRDIRCGFLLLKRTAKPGERIELVITEVPNALTQKSLKVVNNMVASVKKGIAIKNRSSCQYCDYYMTEHCILQM